MERGSRENWRQSRTRSRDSWQSADSPTRPQRHCYTSSARATGKIEAQARDGSSSDIPPGITSFGSTPPLLVTEAEQDTPQLQSEDDEAAQDSNTLKHTSPSSSGANRLLLSNGADAQAHRPRTTEQGRQLQGHDGSAQRSSKDRVCLRACS